MITLNNSLYNFTLDNDKWCWSLSGNRGGQASIENARIGICFRHGLSTTATLQREDNPSLTIQDGQSSESGTNHYLELISEPDRNGLALIVRFELPDNQPFLQWQLAIHNKSDTAIRIISIDLLNCTPHLSQNSSHGAKSRLNGLSSDLAFYANGWQSWSHAGAMSARDRQPGTRLSILRRPAEDGWLGGWRKSGVFTSHMFGVLGSRVIRQGILAGFLTQHNQFGLLQANLHGDEPGLRLYASGDNARLDPGESMLTDWAVVQLLDLDLADPLGAYLEAVAQSNHVNDHASWRIPTGWCSWYQYSTSTSTGDLNADDIRSNLAMISDYQKVLPLQIVQIDDGFETQVGDWFSFRPGFPGGIAPLAQEIHKSALVPGLWLAPFIVDQRSRLAREHPDWLLRSRTVGFANAGFQWERFAVALDLTVPDALAYAIEVIRRAALEWGFPYLKLDFLYAAGLPGRFRDDRLTGAQVLRRGLEELRRAAGPETFLLGCGCPLGSAIGLMDGMRISADVSSRWYPHYLGIETFFKGEPTFPSARNAVLNTLTRAPLHRRWWINDPDCILLRSTTRLSLAEIQAQATAIALTGGMMLLSDDLAQVPAERLRIAQELLPPIDRRPQILDWFDAPLPARARLDLQNSSGEWYLLAYFNWSDQPVDLELDLKTFGLDTSRIIWCRDFWSSHYSIIRDGQWKQSAVQPHGAVFLTARHLTDISLQYLGSSLHISQGLEVSEWTLRMGKLEFKLERPGLTQGEFLLRLPAEPISAHGNGEPLAWRAGEVSEVYHFQVEFDRQCIIEINF